MSCFKIKCFYFYFFISNEVLSAVSNYQNFLWAPASPSSVSNAIAVTMDDSAVSQALITFPQINSWKVLATSCSGHWDGLQRGNYRYWLQYKTGWQKASGGLVYRFSDISNWDMALSTPVPGVNTMVSTNHYDEQGMSGCWQLGKIVGFTPSLTIPVFRVNIELQRSSAFPGKYTVRVPYWWGYEENKASGYDEAIAWRRFGIIMQNEAPSYIDIPVVVTSKCNFNTSPINLSHGSLSGRAADGNQTTPYNLNVTCASGTSLSVKLIGSQKVSGKTDNYTLCGSGGMCELTFDNGKYNETMTIYNSKTLSIKSTYRLNDITKPVAESFEGSGVLQVLVN
ncbi:PixG protein [Salmonella enterica]|uniref:PixG protein n=2 Tax=Salmonella enterica TaxID=28901 RepID=A0A6Y2USK7_SALDZ|nr:PixG protein [Salmonella enterica]ECZ5352130.1 PixG protein [Salmonella enterica subsp. diarizonae]EEH1955465.1 PixG protein [Salmonella enterica subsp. diarizonae serovar 61:k:1,5,(7)]ECR6931143.1 PixG protein [Salmonella enterica]EEU3867394.1 PixG protein [Salmonella enterica subsp. diarizonae]